MEGFSPKINVTKSRAQEIAATSGKQAKEENLGRAEGDGATIEGGPKTPKEKEKARRKKIKRKAAAKSLAAQIQKLAAPIETLEAQVHFVISNI